MRLKGIDVFAIRFLGHGSDLLSPSAKDNSWKVGTTTITNNIDASPIKGAGENCFERTVSITISVAFSHANEDYGEDDNANSGNDDDDNANSGNDDDDIAPALVATARGSPAVPCRWWTSLAGRRWGCR